ncbi:WxL domain-containing protein [Latilactobacillus fuchuensis]|uniref:Cell surface protein n=1 Tax=Latilactobacillus fuchuensis DSM 14340 = JCM 11249 TaxID=1423747 RepID=A0A0R1S3C2_9LACO|nr:WxL domain-containing protein [Latilactobacillus fuchuensis]KRL61306.1 cell surface protein [Latilactobacillus fuchuensis DSM 14340 = JCM 11249]
MKINKVLMASAVVLATSVNLSSVAMAAEAGSVTTKGDVTFVEDTDPTTPVDPTDPDIPVDPTDPDKPNSTEGPLSIDYASNLHFGEQKISAKTQTYFAAMDKIKDPADANNTLDKPNWVQVTDKRGTNVGWKLQVQQGAQFATGAAEELKGAEIKLMNGATKSTSDNQAGVPTASQEITLVPGDSTTAGAAQDVMTAQADQGMGTWTNGFGDDTTGSKSISLTVPGASAKVKDGKYTTDLTWVLTDTPA